MKDGLKEKEIVELIVKRLESIPPHIKLSIGSEGTFDISTLIEHVKKRDALGKKVINFQLAYIRSLKKLSKK